MEINKKFRMITTSISLFACLQIIAQKSFFVRPILGYNNTNLYNAEDSKQAKNTLLGSTPIPIQPTFAPNVGLQIGYSFDRNKFGLETIYSGIAYTPVIQKYSGYLPYDTLNINNRFEDANATIKLNYVSIPIIAEIYVTKPHKITPFVSVGFNVNFLSNYKVNYQSPYFNNSTYNFDIQNYSFSNIVTNDPLNSYTASINKWIYNKIVFTSFIGIGAKISLKNNMGCQILLNNSYSFGDIENKTAVIYNYNDAIHTGQTVTKNPYEYYYAFTKNRSRWANGTTRNSTHIIQTGLTIGFTYYFIRNLKK